MTKKKSKKSANPNPAPVKKASKKTLCFSKSDLAHELKVHARAIGLPSGATETFVSLTIRNVSKRLSQGDYPPATVRNVVAIELKKYSPDLAYAYKNHDKII